MHNLTYDRHKVSLKRKINLKVDLIESKISKILQDFKNTYKEITCIGRIIEMVKTDKVSLFQVFSMFYQRYFVDSIEKLLKYLCFGHLVGISQSSGSCCHIQ